MFRKFREFEKRFVVNFNKDDDTGKDKDGGGDKGTGGGGTGNAELDLIKAELAKTKAELEGLRVKDVNLNDKVKKDQDDKSKRDSDSKVLESAISFNYSLKDFIKGNDSMLPKEFNEIITMADKEKYDSAVHKSNAIKSAFIQSFFSQQSNVDLLTETQQTALADYQKLTKNGKDEQAPQLYSNLFEPALASLKRVKKAEDLYRAKQGYSGNTDSDQAYKEKMTKLAEKKFFRGNKNA